MSFDPNKYQSTGGKYIPVILLLDVSGSMAGDKIDSLYDATTEMIKTFADIKMENQIKVAIITFGEGGAKLHTQYTDAVEVLKHGLQTFVANGNTPMGAALEMAKDMIDDKNVTPGKWYIPSVILVSDGEPNDSWEEPMRKFINEGRSKKSQRLAMAIGQDANITILEKFADNQQFVFHAEDAHDISANFKKITMSVSQRSVSKNPNAIPHANGAEFDNPSTAASTRASRRAQPKPTGSDDEDIW